MTADLLNVPADVNRDGLRVELAFSRPRAMVMMRGLQPVAARPMGVPFVAI